MNVTALDRLVNELGAVLAQQLPGTMTAESRVVRQAVGLKVESRATFELLATETLVLSPLRLVEESAEEVIRAIVGEHLRPFADRLNRAAAGALTAWELGLGPQR